MTRRAPNAIDLGILEWAGPIVAGLLGVKAGQVSDSVEA